MPAIAAFAVLSGASFGQQAADEAVAPPPGSQTAVNWIYGAYISKSVPLEPLNGHQRLKLYVRQSFTTPGIYIKTVVIATDDQYRGSPAIWPQDFSGYAKRLGTEHTKSLIQTSITSAGDGIMGWEPRYDRCHCTGLWKRAGHAVARNLVTYDRTERNLRPQLMPYLGAFTATEASASWQSDHPNYAVKAYQSAVNQLWLGAVTNLTGEFLPDITRKFKLRKR